ncbi:sulfite exporter TauE/SafE family protein [Candidatus Woesearchaeota archaeon]|nr:sulfite exporter TauE/SafE family protein [Candidatus Woesearchaeota archaeon]
MKAIYLIFVLLILSSVAIHAHDTGEEHAELPDNIIKQIEYQKSLALGVTFLIALLAGLLTFTSPCSFAILPIYFSFVFKKRHNALLFTSSFIFGLTIAFALFGFIAGIVGDYFNDYKLYFASISGIFISIFGIMMILNKGFSIFTPKISEGKNSIFSFVLFGFLFGAGWSPCVGPILGSIFFLAANSGTLLKSTLLLITYSAGISIPLLLFSYISDRTKLSDFLNNIKQVKFKLLGNVFITNWYGIVGGLLTFIMGILIMKYNGTSYVEYIISYTTGWAMFAFVGFNNRLRDINLPNGLSNILGILTALIIFALITAIIFNALKKKE